MADNNIYIGFPKSLSILRPDGSGKLLGIERKVLYHPTHKPIPDLSYGHTLVDKCDTGLYFKFLAKKSDYQYTMTFPKYQKRIKTKSLGRIQNTDTNRARALSQTHEIGKSVNVQFKVVTRILSDDENIATSILYSPEVYLWQEESVLSGVSCSEWIKVFIRPGTFTTFKDGQKGVKLSFTAQIDGRNVQSIV